MKLKTLEKYWYVIAAAMGVVVTAVSLWLAYGQSIWFDENYSIMLAKHSLPELLALTAVDAHPPLYYVLLHFWGSVWDWWEVPLRGLSALCMGAATVMAIVLLRKLFNAQVALMSVPFLALAPFALRYGYEIRMYALVTLIGLIATWVLVRATESKSWKWWATYAVLVALGMYTLYMSMVIWLAHLVWLVVITKPKKDLFKQPFVGAYAGAIVLFAPYIPTFIHQMLNSALPGIGSEVTLTKLASVLGMITVYTPEWLLGGWVSLALVVGMVLFGITYASVWRQKGARRSLLLLTFLVVVPLVFYAVTSLPPRQPIFIERYMAHIAVYVYMLTGAIAALGWLGGKRRAAGALAALVLVLGAMGVARLDTVGNLNLERMQYPMTRFMVAGAECGPDIIVVADDPYTYIDSEYYFNDYCELKFYSKDDVDFRGGYAPLHGSDKRIASPSDITAFRIIHLRWKDATPAFQPDKGYSLVSSETYDKQVMDVYER